MAGVPAVQWLVESGISKVPHRFVRAAGERASRSAAVTEEIPVIDVSRLDDELELGRIYKACTEWGFCQLINHGIPSSLLQSTREVIHEFFKLPQEEKESYSAPSRKTGKEGYGRYFLPSDDVVLDWGDVFFHLLPPAAIQWPVNPPNYKGTIQAYTSAIQALAVQLLGALSKAVGQPEDMFNNGFGVDRLVSLRMNYYPPCPEPDVVLGLSPHSDGVGITLLLQDEVEGLEVKKNGNWIPVKSIPDALVFNIGDIVEMMSNGIYKSVEHRAVVSSGKARVSAATFYSPGFDQQVGPLLKDAQPIFKTMAHSEFLGSLFSKVLDGKHHLDSVRL